MVVLTAAQEAKIWRLRAEERSLHALLQSFRGRRADLVDKMTHIDRQIASEADRGKTISDAMRHEIQVMKRPLEVELAGLVNEEASVTQRWREAAQLANSLDKYAASVKRGN